ncbi:hypothetical protein GALMADRAFT_143984 [Galerina marginata CBS 339.88]|uniref:Uncharacterized protein n=1 Tax=Galerina marginata (strain CBS 339.88) TaxID=685588 RepID=A0A067SWY9_GALM3|nr:hypothetical protein GALMADRAFT_143984 [Galerina marginata CBS 339.88]
MKLLSLALLPILAGSLVSAASVSGIEPRDVDAGPTPAQTAVTYIKNTNNKAAINPVCFYSGQTMVTKIVNKKSYTSVKTADAALGAFKGAPRNCKSIADVLAKAGVQSSALSQSDWKAVSKALAENVSGKAYVLLGKDIRSNSVWITDEKPALKANGAVTLEVWEIETDGSVVKTNKTKANV